MKSSCSNQADPTDLAGAWSEPALLVVVVVVIVQLVDSKKRTCQVRARSSAQEQLLQAMLLQGVRQPRRSSVGLNLES